MVKMRALWAFGATLISLQMLVYFGLLIWPGETDLHGAMVRFSAWQATGALVVQIFALLPLLIVLIWQFRHHTQARLLLGGALILSAALVVCAWIELWLIEAALADLVNMADRARQLVILRWAEAALAFCAAITLRLGYVSGAL
ncbi:hypothetical protein [uncultured Thioclava sp.]|uniref:hypothetical protein n=1 Tax=uncultured Thioclava sp. TaxID=473858 RepID=UPI0025E89590|nr:hypothetical protein [uncultured Thioclava sp.]